MIKAKPNTRSAILRLLKETPGLTAHHLAAALGVTAVAVRKHLDALEHEGLVSVDLRRQPLGRPTYAYQLTAGAAHHFPQGYRQMLLDLLQDLAASDGEQKVKLLFEGRAERQRLSYERKLGALPLPERLRELARLRNEDGYMTSLEEGDEDFILRQHNCPVEEVSRRFQQNCGCEIEMLRRLLETKHIERVAAVRDGATSCAYRIAKPRRAHHGGPETQKDVSGADARTRRSERLDTREG